MIRAAVFAAGLPFVFGALILAGQETGADRLRTAYGADAAARIEAVIAAAERDGVPRSLLIDTALEGAAKGEGADVVLRAVTAYGEELRAAVRLLGRQTDPRSLKKAADAARHGLDPGFVRGLWRAHPADFPMLVQVVEDLLHEEVGLEVAQGIVREAAERGMSAKDVVNLPAVVRRLVRDGATPAAAASSVRQSVRLGRPVVPPAASPGDPPGAARAPWNPERAGVRGHLPSRPPETSGPR